MGDSGVLVANLVRLEHLPWFLILRACDQSNTSQAMDTAKRGSSWKIGINYNHHHFIFIEIIRISIFAQTVASVFDIKKRGDLSEIFLPNCWISNSTLRFQSRKSNQLAAAPRFSTRGGSESMVVDICSPLEMKKMETFLKSFHINRIFFFQN